MTSDVEFLLRKHNSEHEFKRKLAENYSDDSKKKNLYLICLGKLHEAVSEGNIELLKRMCKVFLWLKCFLNITTVTDVDCDDRNPLKGSNLIILACKYNSLYILKELYKENHWRSLGSSVSPDAVDRTGHDAMYYALRSGNMALINSLVDEWPEGFFEANPRKLDTIISKAYEKLTNRNVPITKEVQFYVAEKLINLRFFSETKPGEQSVVESVEGIIERVDFLNEQVRLLESEHNKGAEEAFMLIIKYIAYNINTLKQQLRCTYDRLPWEEIEYCVISYILAQTKESDTNVHVLASLNKEKILNYLKKFVENLSNEICNFTDKTIKELKTLPKLSRLTVRKGILESLPVFEDLYCDFQRIRDMHSLLKIESHIERAVKADAFDRVGQLEISWCLLVIGEHLKCTLESPKLSEETSEQVVGALREETRKAIVDIRDGLAHDRSLADRTGLPAATFSGLQDDLQKVGELVHCVLQQTKHALALQLIEFAENVEDIDLEKKLKRGIRCVGNVSHASVHTSMYFLNNAIQLLVFLKNNVLNKTEIDDYLFDKTKQILENRYNEHKSHDLISELFPFVLNHFTLFKKKKISWFRNTKTYIRRLKESIASQDKDSLLIHILMLTLHFYDRISTQCREELHRLLWFVAYKEGFGRLEKFRNICKNVKFKKPLFEKCITQSQRCERIEENILKLKFGLNDHLTIAVHMMGMDVLSVLDSENYLETDLFLLDNSCPLIMGKTLRNYLAHDNQIIQILSMDPTISVELNLSCLSKLKLPATRKIGYACPGNIKELRKRFEESLKDVRRFQSTIEAVKLEDLDRLRSLVDGGAEIRSRSLVNSKSLLHWAVAGRSLELVKYLVDVGVNVDEVDNHGESALHVAAAKGAAETVRYLVEVLRADVHCLDSMGMTPLHHAARSGDTEVVRALLKCGASLSITCNFGCLPIQHSVIVGRRDIFNILREADPLFDMECLDIFLLASVFDQGEFTNILKQLGTKMNVLFSQCFFPIDAVMYLDEEVINVLLMNGADINMQNEHGHSALHYAASMGHTDAVRHLLKNKADVNMRDHEFMTPLHHAINNKHFHTTKILINGGADLNASDKLGLRPVTFALSIKSKNILELLIKKGASLNSDWHDGVSPLHLASQHGFETTIALIIKSGGSVNSRDSTGKTPLHYACENNQLGAVKLLIKNGANVHMRDNYSYFKDNNFKPLFYAVRNLALDIILIFMDEYNISHDNLDYLAVALSGFTSYNNFSRDTSKEKKEIIQVLTQNNFKICKSHLILAVSHHKDVVKIILEKVSKLDWVEEALVSALDRGVSEDIVEMLLDRLSSGGRPFSELWLYLACGRGYKRTVVRLLEAGGKLNTHCEFSLLHLAALGGSVAVARLLLDRGADPDLLDLKTRTPLHLAAESGHVGVVRLLLAKRARLHIADRPLQDTPFYAALSNGHHPVVRALLNAQISSENKIFREKFLLLSVICSIQKGHLENTMLLIDKFKSSSIINKFHEGKSLLHIAASVNNVHIIEYLVTNGADSESVTNEGDKPIHLAAKNGILKNLKLFLKCGKSCLNNNKFLYTLIHCTVLETNSCTITGRLEVLRYLLQEGMDVNVKDITGSTPLHLAAKSGHVELVRAILESGAIFDMLNNEGKQPLDLASDKAVKALLMSVNKLFEYVKKNNLLALSKLIQEESSIINVKNSKGKTVLHYACWKGNKDVIACLLDNGANPEVADSLGWTPLHYCAKFSDITGFCYLINHGASYNPLSASGKEPRDLTSNPEILDILAKIELLYHLVQRKSCPELIQAALEAAKVVYENQRNVHLLYIAKDRNGKTVNDLAKETGNIKLIGFINRYYADFYRIRNKMNLQSKCH